MSTPLRIETRPYVDETDQPLIASLIQAAPDTTRHLVDFPWRLSSPLADAQRDACVWLLDGEAVGFAAWRVWWAVLDWAVRPGLTRHAVERAILAWAPERFRELDVARGRPLPYWVEAREDDHEHLALFAAHGYTLDDDFAYVMMSRDLAGPIPPPILPPGITIRPLAGVDEVDAYAALHRRAFASTAMTAWWRARTLRAPQYLSDLDLVAAAPDGRLVGLCVGWLAPERSLAQIEPLGVDPQFQGHGLGRALLLEMLQRFKAHGVARAQVEPESSRTGARRVYESVGLQPIYRSLRKGQWFVPQDVRGS